MALNPTYTPDEGDWICARCGGPLEQKTLAVLAHITNSRNLQYWGANFNAV